MIKIDQECTYIAGELGDIATEFSMGLRSFYTQMEKALGKEKADFILASIGRCAVATDEELSDRMKEMNDE